MNMLNIAIDGPSGAGKSSIARAVSEKKGFLYIDTGALYRAIGLYVLRQGGDLKRAEQALPQIALTLTHESDGQHVWLNGTDVSADIRTPAAAMAASDVSALPEVREFLLDLQRNMAKSSHVVMDGRDIGTVILPHAQVKIFLTAAPEVRARRRYDELCQKGQTVSYDEVLSDIITRDYNDSNRAVAPLVQAPDAIVCDTSNHTFLQAVAQVEQIIDTRIKALGLTIE